MNFLRSDKNAQWIVPVVLGLVSCVGSFAPMLYFWGTVIIPIDAEHMPLGETVANAIALAERLSTTQIVYTFFMYCIPPALLITVGLVSFVLIRGYQDRNAHPPAPPRPPEPK